MNVVIFVAAVAVFAAQSDVPKVEPPGISIVASNHQQVPDVQRASLAFDLAQSVLGRRNLPHLHIVLMYADKETARTQGFGVDVFSVHVLDREPSTYYVWIAGGPDDDRLAMACVMVLDRQWELKLDKGPLVEAAYRVRQALSGTVSAKDLPRQPDLKSVR